jgi:hypothetical protein
MSAENPAPLSFVLPRRNLASSSRRSVLNPLSFMRLQPLCFRFSTPLLCFQWFAASFSKTPGVACTQQEPPSRISNLPARRPRTVCKPVTLASLGSICKPFPFILLRIAISTSPLFSQSSALPLCFPPQRNRSNRMHIPKSGTFSALLGVLCVSALSFSPDSPRSSNLSTFNCRLSTALVVQLECV